MREEINAEQHVRGPDREPLTESKILAWADAFFERQGDWPAWNSGSIRGAGGDTWFTVAAALALGRRGLPRVGSLSRFFLERRLLAGPNPPEFSSEQILAWIDAWMQATGHRPMPSSGQIPGSGRVNWRIVDTALRLGYSDAPGQLSLQEFLRTHRPHRCHAPLTEDQILSWADAQHARTGRWPTAQAGPVVDAPGETWLKLNYALIRGRRGLPGGSSLARLLDSHRGRRPRGKQKRLPLPSVAEVLGWADAYHARTGRWPTCNAEPIPECPGRTWKVVSDALSTGACGVPRGTTLPKLLAERRGLERHRHRPDLTLRQVVAWMTAYRERTGRWPNPESGPIAECPSETWFSVDYALTKGRRGLPRGLRLRGLRQKLQLSPKQVPRSRRGRGQPAQPSASESTHTSS
jgi:hypothetical protein